MQIEDRSRKLITTLAGLKIKDTKQLPLSDLMKDHPHNLVVLENGLAFATIVKSAEPQKKGLLEPRAQVDIGPEDARIRFTLGDLFSISESVHLVVDGRLTLDFFMTNYDMPGIPGWCTKAAFRKTFDRATLEYKISAKGNGVIGLEMKYELAKGLYGRKETLQIFSDELLRAIIVTSAASDRIYVRMDFDESGAFNSMIGSVELLNDVLGAGEGKDVRNMKLDVLRTINRIMEAVIASQPKPLRELVVIE